MNATQLYVFKCEHGKHCNFISDCSECAKAKLSSQSAYIKRLEDALKDIRRDTAGLYQETDSKSLMNRLIDVRGRAEKALASKESIDG